jgi:hypothetical protein
MRELDLRPDYGDCNPHSTRELRTLAQTISQRLMKLELLTGGGNAPHLNVRAGELANEFNRLARKPTLSVDQFNVQMTSLYNWATTPVGEARTQRACNIILED